LTRGDLGFRQWRHYGGRGGRGRTAPGDAIQGGDTRLKLFLWLNVEKNTG